MKKLLDLLFSFHVLNAMSIFDSSYSCNPFASLGVNERGRLCEPDSHLKTVSEQLETRFGRIAMLEITPRIRDFGNNTYMRILKNMMHRDQTYGQKTRYRAFHQTIEEIISFGEEKNGQLTQSLFDGMRQLTHDPKNILHALNDPCITAISDYMLSRADIFQAEKSYQHYHLQTFGRYARLRDE